MGYTGSFLESLYDMPGKSLPASVYSSVPHTSAVPARPLDSRVSMSMSETLPSQGLHKSGVNAGTTEGVGNGKAEENYAMNKLLGAPGPVMGSGPQVSQMSYYQQQPFPNHAPPRYEMHTSRAVSSAPVNYANYSQPPQSKAQSDPTAKVEQILHHPKQTLHYGQPVMSTTSMPQNQISHHSQSFETIPKQTDQQTSVSQTHLKPQTHYPTVPHSSSIANPVPVHGVANQMRSYGHQPAPSHGNFSPAQFPKGNNPQQIHAPVAARPTMNHNGEPPGYPGHFSQAVTCYLCHAPFPNMKALSEHMKGHAQGLVNQNVAAPHHSFGHGLQHPNVSNSNQLPHGHGNTPYGNHVPPQKQSQQGVKEFKCKVCSSVFTEKPLLTEHMKTHPPPEKFECSICQKKFKSKLKCARHEKGHQKDVRLIYCELCEAGFEFKGNYLDHVLKTHGNVTVSVGDLKIREPSAGTKKAIPLTGGSIDRSFESVDSEAEKMMNCQVCDHEIEAEKLMEHLKKHQTINCEKCDQVFIHKTEYVAHLMREHRNELPESSDINKTVSKIVETIKEKVKSPNKDAVLKEKVPAPVVLETNKPEVPKVSKPEKENKKSVKESKPVELDKNAKQNLVEKKDAKDQILNEKSEKRKSNAKVTKGIVYDDVDEGKRCDESGTKSAETKVNYSKYHCYECNIPFPSHNDLSKHFETHEKDPNRFYCEVCFSSYHHRLEKGYYIYHMKYHCDEDLIETNQPEDLQCNVCRKSFKKTNLVTHIRQEHAVYSCDICEWSYSAEKVLVNHMKKCHPREHKNFVFVEKPYDPSVLQYKTPEEKEDEKDKGSDIVQGNDSMNKSSILEKTIPCSMCDKMFSRKQYLDRHMLSHTSTEKIQIVCELCNETFSCKGAYLYHVQYHALLLTLDLKSEGSSTDNKHEVIADVKDVKIENKDKVTNSISNNCDEKVDSTALHKEDIKMSERDERVHESKNVLGKSRQVEMTSKMVLNPMTGELEETSLAESEEEPGLKEDPDNLKTEIDERKITAENCHTCNDASKKVDCGKDSVVCRLCSVDVLKIDFCQHMKSHKLYNCFSCEFSFVKLSKYSEHRQQLHLEDYIADEIRRFETMDAPEPEEGKNESGVGEKENSKRKRGAKLFNCPLCNTELKQDKCIEHLKSHIKPSFHCEFCKRPYSKLNTLKMHEKSHERVAHPKTELPHPKTCPVCDCRIESRPVYVSHIQTHRRKGSSLCNLCEVAFLSEKTLENHTRVYHDTQVRVFWKLDGEGLKFDLRTGRISEVMSDHLAEIREINELMKQNGRPEIMSKLSPKKYRERSLSSKGGQKGGKGVGKEVAKRRPSEKSESEVMSTATSVTEEDNVKIDSSDEEYVPDGDEDENDATLKVKTSARTPVKRRQSGVRNVSKSEKKDKTDEKEEKEEEDKQKDEESEEEPGNKRRRSLRIRKGEDEDVDSEEEEQTEKELYKPKGTRTRKVVNEVKKKALEEKSGRGSQVKSGIVSRLRKPVPKGNDKAEKTGGKLAIKHAGRVLRSALERRKMKPLNSRLALRRQLYVPLRSGSRRPRVLEEGDVGKKGDSSVLDKSVECPHCEKRFTNAQGLSTHVLFKHKDGAKNMKKRKSDHSPIVGKLKTRTRNLENDMEKPLGSSTPKRSPKLVVRLSPLDDSQFKQADTSTDSLKIKCDNELKDALKKKPVDKNNDKEKDKSSEKPKSWNCGHCDKVYLHQSNVIRHIKCSHPEEFKKEHKTRKSREAKGQDEESYPFVCKECSQSFKKKRDLYIHAKEHDNGHEKTDSQSDAAGLCNDESSQPEAEETMGVSRGDQNEKGSGQTGISAGKRKVGEADMDNNSEDQPSKKQNTANVDKVEKIVNLSSEEGKNMLLLLGKEGIGNNNVSAGEGGRGLVNSFSQEQSGCENKNLRLLRQNSVSVSEDSRDYTDSEERRTPKPQMAPKKISAENALQKWRNKVREVLASQLELNAAKNQEKLENPGIAKVKEKLSTKLKSEVKNFECRICGDKFNDEVKFRGHMDGHMYESPPYCSICDIYFMAIYPKKRLADHNRKKHPIV